MVLRNMHTAGWCVALGALLLLPGCASTSGTRKGLPEWVRDPVSIENSYPRRSYFIGMGVCGGASSSDSMSRKQAEAMAVADIASVVEVQINDTVEDLDTSVERNGQLLSQSVRIQTTKRVVTGILSGVEVKEVFFDERALNWHALAVLDRMRAGAGASEAVAQRLARGRAILDGLGQAPVMDLMALRKLAQVSTELDRLAVALAIFAPARKAAAKTEIEALQSDIAAQWQAVQARAAVRIVVRSDTPGPLPESLASAATKALEEAGFAVVTVGGAGELQVDVAIKTARQVGSMLIYEVTSGATFRLVEQGRTVVAGVVPMDALSASRSGSEQLSRERSLDRLADRLRMGVTAVLNSEES